MNGVRCRSRPGCDGTVFPVEDVADRARQRWGDVVEGSHTSTDGLLTVDLAPMGEPGYSIRVESSGESLSTDGTAEQAAEVAVWARGLLPDEVPSEIWFYDANGHVVLTPDLTEPSIPSPRPVDGSPLMRRRMIDHPESRRQPQRASSE